MSRVASGRCVGNMDRTDLRIGSFYVRNLNDKCLCKTELSTQSTKTTYHALLFCLNGRSLIFWLAIDTYAGVGV